MSEESLLKAEALCDSTGRLINALGKSLRTRMEAAKRP